MSNELQNRQVAILATEGFEYVELTKPKQALEEAGAKTQVISPKAGKIRGWDIDKWGDEVPVDVSLDAANPEDYDALLLPGGVINPGKLRQEPKAVREGLFRGRKTGGLDLSRALDAGGSRCRPWAHDHILALFEN